MILSISWPDETNALTLGVLAHYRDAKRVVCLESENIYRLLELEIQKLPHYPHFHVINFYTRSYKWLKQIVDSGSRHTDG